MTDVLRLDNDTAIVPGLIVKVELREGEMWGFGKYRHIPWQVVVTTTGGSALVLASEDYMFAFDDDHDWDERQRSSDRAKERLVVLYERVLAAVQDASLTAA